MPVACGRFEEHFWKKGRCRDCWGKKEDHVAGSSSISSSEQQQQSPPLVAPAAAKQLPELASPENLHKGAILKHVRELNARAKLAAEEAESAANDASKKAQRALQAKFHASVAEREAERKRHSEPAVQELTKAKSEAELAEQQADAAAEQARLAIEEELNAAERMSHMTSLLHSASDEPVLQLPADHINQNQHATQSQDQESVELASELSRGIAEQEEELRKLREEEEELECMERERDELDKEAAAMVLDESEEEEDLSGLELEEEALVAEKEELELELEAQALSQEADSLATQQALLREAEQLAKEAEELVRAEEEELDLERQSLLSELSVLEEEEQRAKRELEQRELEQQQQQQQQDTPQPTSPPQSEAKEAATQVEDEEAAAKAAEADEEEEEAAAKAAEADEEEEEAGAGGKATRPSAQALANLKALDMLRKDGSSAGRATARTRVAIRPRNYTAPAASLAAALTEEHEDGNDGTDSLEATRLRTGSTASDDSLVDDEPAADSLPAATAAISPPAAQHQQPPLRHADSAPSLGTARLKAAPLSEKAGFARVHSGLGDWRVKSAEESVPTAIAREQTWRGQMEQDKAGSLAREALLSPEEISKRSQQRAESLALCFVAGLKSRASELEVSPQQIADLVINLELLSRLHAVFLDDLEHNLDDAAGTLLRYGDFFRFYKQYLNGYDQSLQTFNQLRDNRKFQTFLGDVRRKLNERSDELGKLSGQSGPGATRDLMSYMIMPVQRVPRYVLLLKALRKETSPKSEEYDKIDEALFKLQEVASDMNESKRAMEWSTKLLEVQSRIENLPKQLSTLLEPGRQLVRSATLIEQSASTFGSYKAHRRLVYLFSDLLLWVNVQHKYKGHMKLATGSLESGATALISMKQQSTVKTWDASLEEKVDCLQAIGSSTVYLILQFPDAKSCQSWEADIRPRIERAKAARSKALALRSNMMKNRTEDWRKQQSAGLGRSQSAALISAKGMEISSASPRQRAYALREEAAEKRRQALMNLQSKMLEGKAKQAREEIEAAQEEPSPPPPATAAATGGFKPRQVTQRRGMSGKASTDALETRSSGGTGMCIHNQVQSICMICHKLQISD
eukprot:g31868.t1